MYIRNGRITAQNGACTRHFRPDLSIKYPQEKNDRLNQIEPESRPYGENFRSSFSGNRPGNRILQKKK